jgi:hypothetical protein
MECYFYLYEFFLVFTDLSFSCIKDCKDKYCIFTKKDFLTDGTIKELKNGNILMKTLKGQKLNKRSLIKDVVFKDVIGKSLQNAKIYEVSINSADIEFTKQVLKKCSEIKDKIYSIALSFDDAFEICKDELQDFKNTKITYFTDKKNDIKSFVKL